MTGQTTVSGRCCQAAEGEAHPAGQEEKTAGERPAATPRSAYGLTVMPSLVRPDLSGLVPGPLRSHRSGSPAEVKEFRSEGVRRARPTTFHIRRGRREKCGHCGWRP